MERRCSRIINFKHVNLLRVFAMNKESMFWMVVTMTALAALAYLLGQSYGNPPFSTADDRHALA